MNKRQRRKLAKSMDCRHLKYVDNGFNGYYKCELKRSCNDEESCKGYIFSRKVLKYVLQNNSANRRMLKKLLKQSGCIIKSRAQLNFANVGATVYKHKR